MTDRPMKNDTSGAELSEATERVQRIRLFAQDLLDNGHLYGGAIGDVMAIRDEADALLAARSEGPAPDGYRQMAQALADLTDAFLELNGCFPLDEYTPALKRRKEAMSRAYDLIGQPNTPDRDAKLALLSAAPTPEGVKVGEGSSRDQPCADARERSPSTQHSDGKDAQ